MCNKHSKGQLWKISQVLTIGVNNRSHVVYEKVDSFQNNISPLFHEKTDHFSRKKKDGTIKKRPFCSKDYAQSLGTVRWTLAPSNVEIIDSFTFLKMVNFSQKKSFFSRTTLLIELKLSVQMRETILEKWIPKKSSIKYSFFQRKMPPASS